MLLHHLLVQIIVVLKFKGHGQVELMVSHQIIMEHSQPLLIQQMRLVHGQVLKVLLLALIKQVALDMRIKLIMQKKK